MALALGIAACSQPVEPAPRDTGNPKSAGSPTHSAPMAEAGTDGSIDATDRATEPSELAAKDLVLAEWRKADNRETCTAISFASTGTEGTPRRANFGGGWAVAWDQPGLRSAFGVAGTGFVPSDIGYDNLLRSQLQAQWPYFRELAALPQPAFAGYGIEGAEAYSESNPEGYGLKSLAYVRVDGQTCDYNVWSRLGRPHLEALLENLRVIPR